MQIKNKTILITGASSGIGRACALELASYSPKNLILLSRNSIELMKARQEILDLGVKAHLIECDITDEKATVIAIAEAWKRHGGIDIVISNAGVANQSEFTLTKQKHVKKEIEVNLFGMYNVLLPLVKRMKSRNAEGYIVIVSSLMARLASPLWSTYGATKAAQLNFAKAIRAELEPHGVHVGVLMPPLVETEMTKDIKRPKIVISCTMEKVTKALVNGILTNKKEIVTDYQSRIVLFLYKFFPGFIDYLIRILSL